jgi:membrane protease YdiL (CAAX protease family)
MMRGKIIAAIAVEIAYATFTRTWLPRHAQGVELELAISACRLVTAGVYWLLFRQLIVSRAARTNLLRSPLVLAASAVVLAIPFLFRGWDPGGGLGTAVVFALTSVIVGLREELLYRGVLINLLQPRVGVHGAIGLSTVVFLVYHYGALPLAPLPAIEVVCMSLLLGIVYAYSGSLLFVIALHSLYDGIWFFGAYLREPLSDVWRLAFLLSGLALAVLWASRMPNFSRSRRAEARRST